jgi:uncharacterized protein
MVFFLGAVILSTTPLFSEVKIPELSGRVIDQVGVLNQNQVNALEEKLKSLESQKGSQLAILVIPTTDGEIDRAIFPSSSRRMEARKKKGR